jgi:hypothetical protein
MKTPGISSADVSLEKGEADVVLKPGNSVTIPQLRQLLKRNGYPTKDARIIARGRLSLRGSRVVLDLLNGTPFDVAVDPKAASTIGVLVGDASHPIVEVTAISRLNGKTDELTLTGVVPPGGS